MKIKSIICSIVTLGLLAGGLTACMTEKGESKEGEKATSAKLEAQAKITKAEAQKIALDKVPGGTIKEGDIEKEKGKLLWSFDIATPGTKDITEVQVDAMTGDVLDVAKETVADQEKEKKEDSKMKAKKEKDDDDKEETK
ncbi:MAG TPA: PepSY domain-containing protein [Verrucomicrobiae bacterium]